MGKKNNVEGFKINSPKRRRFVIAKFLIKPLKLGPKLPKKLKEERKRIRLKPENPYLAPFCPKSLPPQPPFWCKRRHFPSIPAAGLWIFGFSLRIWGSRGTGGAASPESRRDLGQKCPELGKSQRETATPAMANQSKPVWDWESVGGGVNTVNGGQKSQNSRGEPRNSMEGVPKFPGKCRNSHGQDPNLGGMGALKFYLGTPKIPRNVPKILRVAPKFPWEGTPKSQGGPEFPGPGEVRGQRPPRVGLRGGGHPETPREQQGPDPGSGERENWGKTGKNWKKMGNWGKMGRNWEKMEEECGKLRNGGGKLGKNGGKEREKGSGAG